MTTNVIETIGSLTELKAYCCPKVVHEKEWYLKCIDCKGLKNCTVGNRAVELMNKQTRPTKKHEGHRYNAHNEASKEKARKNYEEAIQQKDPVAYLMEKHSMTKGAAMAKLHNWRCKYPDIAEKCGLKKHEKLVPTASTDMARERVAKAFESGDAIDYLMNNDGLSYIKARATLSRWSLKYPDLEQKYHIREYMVATISRKGAIGKKEAADMPKQMSDEITVEEFLHECEDSKKEEPETILYDITSMHPDSIASDIVVMSKEGYVNANGTPATIILLNAIKEKQDEYNKEIRDLQNRIALLNDRLETLNKTYCILTEHKTDY